jgi:hypothetical protein
VCSAWADGPNEDPWEISQHKPFMLYTTHGEAVYGHKFGFFKAPGSCSGDTLYISWSTPEASVKEFEGVDATFNLNVDGERFQLTAPLLLAHEVLPGLLTLVTFTNVVADDRLINLLASGSSIDVAINSPSKLRDLMDVEVDSFNLEGFSDTRSRAEQLCFFSNEKSGSA